MKNLISKISTVLFLVAILISPYFVFSAVGATTAAGTSDQQKNPLERLIDVGTTQGPYSSADELTMVQIAGYIISVFLGLLGIIFVGLMIYAGYNWMTAQGEQKKIDTAKSTIQAAIIGLIITASAYAIYFFVFSKLFSVG
jgi:hypothetical protein